MLCIVYTYAPIKLFYSHPPRGHHFFGGCPGLFITLFLPSPTLINHFNPFIFECPSLFHFIFQCPALFITHILTLTPGLPRGGWGQNNLTDTLGKESMHTSLCKEQNVQTYHSNYLFKRLKCICVTAFPVNVIWVLYSVSQILCRSSNEQDRRARLNQFMTGQ